MSEEELLVPIAELPPLLGFADGRLSGETLRLWIRRGTVAADGRRVRLPARRVGARWFCTPRAARRFLDEVNGPATDAAG